MAKIAVERIYIEKPDPRDFQNKLLKLFEKRTIEVKISALIHSIPFITPPFFTTIDRGFTVRIVNRNYWTAR
jgi:hypothetical protein